jgi:tetratricopeptide (TPR) repeat protein
MSTNLSIVDSKVIDKLELRRWQQLEFLLTVLQSVNESNANPDIVYPLFRQNLDLFDLDIIEVLRNWINAKFTELNRDLQELIASDLVSFGNLIQQFPLGNKAINMELSITCYESALEIYTNADFLIDWATTQHNLATAYYNRIRGDKAKNLELSIACYESALEIRTKVNLPMSWAKTQNNLATAYCNRIRGNKAENLERSIVCYESALEIYTKADLPIEWAMTQNNLAAAHSKRIRGDKAENLERSIVCYESALEICTKADLPIEWAMTQYNLAAIYSDRIRGEKAENLEQSIACFQSALEVFTPELFPHEWVKTQINLAEFSIENLDNYQIAIKHLQSAYEHLLTNNNDTGLLAQTMFELARCFHQTGCLEQAKMYFKDSIRLYQRLEQPTQVAGATSALGNLELQMGLIDDARLHLQTALEFYQAAGNLERVTSIQELQQYLPVTSGAKGS